MECTQRACSTSCRAASVGSKGSNRAKLATHCTTKITIAPIRIRSLLWVVGQSSEPQRTGSEVGARAASDQLSEEPAHCCEKKNNGHQNREHIGLALTAHTELEP